MPDPVTAAQRIQVPRIIHLALMASVGIYGFIGWTLTKQPLTTAVPPPQLWWVFAALVLGETALLPILRPRLFPTEATPPKERLQKLFSASILTWALCESMAIFGLVGVMLTHELNWFWGFLAASLVNFVLYAPREEQFQNLDG
jgi:F0F1-type ATP synthase membrane subunit c/vacuolar-type H+-ATPase subunit K